MDRRVKPIKEMTDGEVTREIAERNEQDPSGMLALGWAVGVACRNCEEANKEEDDPHEDILP